MSNPILPRPETLPNLTTKEQVLDLLRGNLVQLQEARELCSVRYPDRTGATVLRLRRAYNAYAIKYGMFLGQLMLARALGHLDDVGYNLLADSAVATSVPSVSAFSRG